MNLTAKCRDVEEERELSMYQLCSDYRSHRPCPRVGLHGEAHQPRFFWYHKPDAIAKSVSSDAPSGTQTNYSIYRAQLRIGLARPTTSVRRHPEHWQLSKAFRPAPYPCRSRRTLTQHR